MEDALPAKTPVHLWIVGILSTLWNAFGAFDYVMTQSDNEAYMSQFPAEQRAYYETFPVWLDAAWALGVWGALAGSLLLLARSRHAVTAFAISLLGLAVSTIYTFGFSQPPEGLMSGIVIIMNIVIWAACIALLLYARRQAARGVLR